MVNFPYRSEFHTQLGAILSYPLINEDFRPSTVSSWLPIQQACAMTRSEKCICIFALPVTDLANNAKVVLLFCLRKYLTKI